MKTSKHPAPLTQDRINRLIARRERLTNRRDGRTNHPAISEIDGILAQVPPGERNDVDLLLGRLCAELPVREGWIVNPVVTMLKSETVAFVEQTRILFEQAEPIEY